MKTKMTRKDIITTINHLYDVQNRIESMAKYIVSDPPEIYSAEHQLNTAALLFDHTDNLSELIEKVSQYVIEKEQSNAKSTR